MSDYVKYGLMVTFSAVLVTANLTASKLAVYHFPVIGTVVGSVAAISIGVSFFCTDVLSELYGKDEARKTVNLTIIALLVAYVLVWAAVMMEPASSYSLNEEFSTIMLSSQPIFIGSVLTLLVSQNLDVSVFHAIKYRTGGRYKFLRNIGSTATSQLVDTAMFTILAFVFLPPLFGGNALPWGIVGGIIFAEYVVKVIVAIVDTPFFYVVTGALEGEINT